MADRMPAMRSSCSSVKASTFQVTRLSVEVCLEELSGSTGSSLLAGRLSVPNWAHDPMASSNSCTGWRNTTESGSYRIEDFSSSSVEGLCAPGDSDIFFLARCIPWIEKPFVSFETDDEVGL